MTAVGPGRPAARSYAAGAAAVSVAAGLVVTGALIARGGASECGWAALGWAPMAVIGTLDGAWLASAHGKAGSGFLAALVAGMLARLAAALASAAVVVKAGGGIAPFLAGWAAGFAPLQVYEVVFFHRTGRARREG